MCIAEAYRAAGKRARAIASWKYTPPALQSAEYQSRTTHRARAPVARNLLDLIRAPPLTLTQWMLEDGLFVNLTGSLCERQACGKTDRSGVHGDTRPQLGQLVGRKEWNGIEKAIAGEGGSWKKWSFLGYERIVAKS